jgi:hypothetical protein
MAKMAVSKEMFQLIVILQSCDVTPEELCDWLIDSVERLLEDIEEGIESCSDDDRKRLDRLHTLLCHFTWNIADDDEIQNIIADMRQCGVSEEIIRSLPLNEDSEV